jgi:hypothetical protein
MPIQHIVVPLMAVRALMRPMLNPSLCVGYKCIDASNAEPQFVCPLQIYECGRCKTIFDVVVYGRAFRCTYPRTDERGRHSKTAITRISLSRDIGCAFSIDSMRETYGTKIDAVYDTQRTHLQACRIRRIATR